jgi:hypothetical protein
MLVYWDYDKLFDEKPDVEKSCRTVPLETENENENRRSTVVNYSVNLSSSHRSVILLLFPSNTEFIY